MSTRSWIPEDQRINVALGKAREVVESPQAVQDLRTYYTRESDYAGATFLTLGDNHPERITAGDLMAATTLSVSIQPMAIRRLTQGEDADEISELLSQLNPGLRLENPTVPDEADTMAALYNLIKRSLRRAGKGASYAWVTASKICARKRPHLFPVRDSVVVEVLDLAGDYDKDWPVFAAIIGDEELRNTLAGRVRDADEYAGVSVGDHTHLLRHLDTLLWMEGKRRRRERRQS